MTKKAIDVVLVPSEDMMDKAIAINRELLKRGEAKKMVLNKTDCLPHISILMGCVADTDFPAVIRHINKIASHYPEFHLQITEVQQEGSSTVLNIQPDDRLQKLHETIVEQLSPFLTYDTSAAMLYHPERPDKPLLSISTTFSTMPVIASIRPTLLLAAVLTS
jgi:2'-5' RNA ligase